MAEDFSHSCAPAPVCGEGFGNSHRHGKDTNISYIELFTYSLQPRKLLAILQDLQNLLSQLYVNKLHLRHMKRHAQDLTAREWQTQRRS